jgi:hypothetical protein
MEEASHVEKLGAVLVGPDKVGAGEVFERFPAPTSSVCAPVMELADMHDLQSCDQSGRPGPIPGWGTTFSPNQYRRDNPTS